MISLQIIYFWWYLLYHSSPTGGHPTGVNINLEIESITQKCVTSEALGKFALHICFNHSRS